MILGFRTQFVNKIIDGTKIHTIRKDHFNRWKAGRKIHFSTGVRTKSYNQFIPCNICKSIQRIEIKYVFALGENIMYPEVYIDGKYCNIDWQEKLAQNDGFENRKEFFKWFDSDFKGKIIHWTDFKY